MRSSARSANQMRVRGGFSSWIWASALAPYSFADIETTKTREILT